LNCPFIITILISSLYSPTSTIWRSIIKTFITERVAKVTYSFNTQHIPADMWFDGQLVMDPHTWWQKRICAISRCSTNIQITAHS
jgi:hypothetical protein